MKLTDFEIMEKFGMLLSSIHSFFVVFVRFSPNFSLVKKEIKLAKLIFAQKKVKILFKNFKF
jgi:hypothetical protein